MSKVAFLVAVCVAAAVPSITRAQGYGEQRTLPFTLSNQNDQTRMGREYYRQSVSSSNRAARITAGSANLGGNLGGLGQTGSDLNNVVQYYNYSSTSVSVPGSNSPVTVGGTLNAGQTSTGTSQVLNNSSSSSSSRP